MQLAPADPTSPEAQSPEEMDAPETPAALHLHALYFLRHAPAGSPEDWEGPDEARPLTAEGRKKLKGAKKGLRKLIGTPDVIVSSHYARAWQTAEAVARQLDYANEIEKSEALGHDGDAAQRDALLLHRAPGSSLLFVGHSPDLERWIARLLGASAPYALELKKGGVCRVDLVEIDGERVATLRWLVTPAVLRSVG